MAAATWLWMDRWGRSQLDRVFYVGHGRPKCVTAHTDQDIRVALEIEHLLSRVALVNAVELHQKMRPQRLLSHACELRSIPDYQKNFGRAGLRRSGVRKHAPSSL